MNKNVERGQATRAHVIEVATRLFAEHGYDDTSIEAVLTDTGVSRGSLYHHFRGKDALFLAVFEAVSARIAAEMTTAIQDAAGPVAMLRAGSLALIRLAGDPVVRQIVLIDAQTVLGWRRWRELDAGTISVIRTALVGAGAVEERNADAFAHIVLAAVNEVAMMIALADDPAAAIAPGESALGDFLDRLLAGPGILAAASGGRRR
jgi:AcrR family transcriptional regulator